LNLPVTQKQFVFPCVCCLARAIAPSRFPPLSVRRQTPGLVTHFFSLLLAPSALKIRFLEWSLSHTVPLVVFTAYGFFSFSSATCFPACYVLQSLFPPCLFLSIAPSPSIRSMSPRIVNDSLTSITCFLSGSTLPSHCFSARWRVHLNCKYPSFVGAPLMSPLKSLSSPNRPPPFGFVHVFVYPISRRRGVSPPMGLLFFLFPYILSLLPQFNTPPFIPSCASPLIPCNPLQTKHFSLPAPFSLLFLQLRSLV